MRRPITIMVAVVAIYLGVLPRYTRMSGHIPDLNLPVIYVRNPMAYDPSQMEGYLVSLLEYHFLYITGHRAVESKSIQNVGLVKRFHPGHG